VDEDKAVWFHNRNILMQHENPRLLHGIVQPEGILAITDDRDESEVVCDPAFVKLIATA